MRRSDRVIRVSGVLSIVMALAVVWVLGTAIAQANGGKDRKQHVTPQAEATVAVTTHGTVASSSTTQADVSVGATCVTAGQSVSATIGIPGAITQLPLTPQRLKDIIQARR